MTTPPDISLGRRTLLGGGVALGLGIIAAGCGPAGKGRSTPSPSGPPGYDGPGLPQLAVEKLFTGEKVKLTQVFRASVVGDTLVLGGRDADNRNAIAALDLISGEPRWEVGDGARGGGVAEDVSLLGSEGWAADDGQSGILLEPYVGGRDGKESTEEFGVVALSLADRSLRWSAVAVPSKPRKSSGDGRFQTVHVVATTPDTVVVNVGGDAIHGVEWNVYNPGQEPRTIGFDVHTGKKLWEVADTLTQLTAGERLLAVRGSSPADSQPLALDPLSGKELWRLPDGEPASWIAAAGELGIIRTGSWANSSGWPTAHPARC